MKRHSANFYAIIALVSLVAVILFSLVASMTAEPLSDVLMCLVLILGLFFVIEINQCMRAASNEKERK